VGRGISSLGLARFLKPHLPKKGTTPGRVVLGRGIPFLRLGRFLKPHLPR
jgi:hypothetical protein